MESSRIRIGTSGETYDVGAACYSQQTGGCPLPTASQTPTSLSGTLFDPFASIKTELWENLDTATGAEPFNWSTTGRECDGNDMKDARQCLPPGTSGSSLMFPMDAELNAPPFETMEFDRFSDSIDVIKFDVMLRGLNANTKQSKNCPSEFGQPQPDPSGLGRRQSQPTFSTSLFDMQLGSAGGNFEGLQISSSLPTPAQLKLADAKLTLDYRSILDAWDIGQGSFLKSEEKAFADDEDFDIDISLAGGKKSSTLKGTRVGAYLECARPRWMQLARYREKKKNRLFDRKVRYGLRKANADSRPRIKGRFVKGLGPRDLITTEIEG